MTYAKIIDEPTKECCVIEETDGLCLEKVLADGFQKGIEVSQAYDGRWYVAGYAPKEPEKSYSDKRAAEYPPLEEQLDMIYHDMEAWRETIAKIKEKYPKA